MRPIIEIGSVEHLLIDSVTDSVIGSQFADTTSSILGVIFMPR